MLMIFFVVYDREKGLNLGPWLLNWGCFSAGDSVYPLNITNNKYLVLHQDLVFFLTCKWQKNRDSMTMWLHVVRDVCSFHNLNSAAVRFCFHPLGGTA